VQAFDRDGASETHRTAHATEVYGRHPAGSDSLVDDVSPDLTAHPGMVAV
jgi:hypothetical protein